MCVFKQFLFVFVTKKEFLVEHVLIFDNNTKVIIFVQSFFREIFIQLFNDNFYDKIFFFFLIGQNQ